MPQPYKQAIITNAGIKLMSEVLQNSELKIEFTRIAIGNGIYTEDEKREENLQNQTDLKSMKNSYGISDASIVSDQCIKVTSILTNTNPASGDPIITDGYYINEAGVFAKISGTEDEILYCLAVTETDQGDYMPPATYPSQIIQDFFLAVSNTDNIKIKVVLSSGHPFIKEVVLPVDGWQPADTGYSIDVHMPISTQDLYPIASIQRDSKDIAKNAALSSDVETLDGALRFWAQSQPEEDISMTVLLFYEVKAGAGGDYVLPIADEDTLGGVMLGNGITGDEYGRISAHANQEDIATAEDVSSMIESIFGGE